MATFLVHVKSEKTPHGERDVSVEATSKAEAVKKVKDTLRGDEARWASVFADGDSMVPAPRSDGETARAGRVMDSKIIEKVADAAMRIMDRVQNFMDDEEQRERQDAAKPGPHNSRELGYGLPSPFNPDNSKSRANPIKKREIVTVAPQNQFPMAHTTKLLQNRMDAEGLSKAEYFAEQKKHLADLAAGKITSKEYDQKMAALDKQRSKEGMLSWKDADEGGGPDVDKIKATKERDTARREAQRRVIELESRAEAMAQEEGVALREELAMAKEALAQLESPEEVDDKAKKDAQVTGPAGDRGNFVAKRKERIKGWEAEMRHPNLDPSSKKELERRIAEAKKEIEA